MRSEGFEPPANGSGIHHSTSWANPPWQNYNAKPCYLYFNLQMTFWKILIMTFITAFLSKLFPSRDVRGLILGLDASGIIILEVYLLLYLSLGKTTLLYKLKLGEVVTTIPTIGDLKNNVECSHFFIYV